MLELTIQKGVNGPPAGVMIEPLQAGGGHDPLSEAICEEVREICDHHGVPLIFDEIQTYVRIGDGFAAQHYGVTPDIIGLGKAMAAGCRWAHGDPRRPGWLSSLMPRNCTLSPDNTLSWSAPSSSSRSSSATSCWTTRTGWATTSKGVVELATGISGDGRYSPGGPAHRR